MRRQDIIVTAILNNTVQLKVQIMKAQMTWQMVQTVSHNYVFKRGACANGQSQYCTRQIVPCKAVIISYDYVTTMMTLQCVVTNMIQL